MHTLGAGRGAGGTGTEEVHRPVASGARLAGRTIATRIGGLAVTIRWRPVACPGQDRDACPQIRLRV